MKYDTVGNKIIEPIQNCDCGLTGGCEKCNPYWTGKLSELEIEKRKLEEWRQRFDEDLERRSKILFSPPPQRIKTMKEEKKIMNFCGCEVILRADIPENRELQSKYIARAEEALKRIIDKEFNPSERDIQKIVEDDLGVKKHWLFGWIKK